MVFDEDEIKCAYLMSKEKLPAIAAELKEVIGKIAMLGGFLGRKSGGEAGSESIGGFRIQGYLWIRVW